MYTYIKSNDVHLKYLTILCANYTSIKLKISIPIQISRPKMELLLSRVPHQQTKTYIALVPLQMLHLTTNSIFSQPVPKHQALGFLTPNKVDSVAPANKIFSIFLFLVLYYLSYKCFLTLCPILQFSERRLKVSII